MAYLASLTVSLTKLVGRIQGQSMYILIRSIHFFECINCSTKNDDNDSSGEFHCCNVLSIKPALYAGSTLNNEYIGKNSPLGTGGKKRRGRGCIGCTQYLPAVVAQPPGTRRLRQSTRRPRTVVLLSSVRATRRERKSKIIQEKYRKSRENDLEKNVSYIFLSPPRLTFLAWGDFHARSQFACSTNPQEKWGLLVV